MLMAAFGDHKKMVSRYIEWINIVTHKFFKPLQEQKVLIIIKFNHILDQKDYIYYLSILIIILIN